MYWRIIFLLLTLPLLGVPGFSQDAAALLKRVKEKLSIVKDYRAEGTMKTDIPFMKMADSKVSIIYKNPDKFRVFREQGISVVPKGGVSINLNSIVAGDDYTMVPAGTATFRGQQVSVVKLLPTKENSEIVLSTLYIDEKEALILKTSTTTRDNGSYEMEFTYGKHARYALPEKVSFLFNLKEYKLPKGVTFEYDTGKQPSGKPQGGKGVVEITYESYVINKGIADAAFL